MAYLGKKIATSTPKQGIKDSSVLRERKWQNIMTENGEKTRQEKAKTGNSSRHFEEEKKVKIRTDKFKSKENRRRNPYREKQSARKEADNAAEKRRNQAVEAMQIAELRRRRMTDEEKLAEDMENLNVSATEYLPDGRIKLNRQQLFARTQKRKRIEHFLREQEDRKKRANKRKSVTFKEPLAWTPRPKFQKSPENRRPQAVEYSAKVAPIASTSTIKEVQQQPTTSSAIVLVQQAKIQPPKIATVAAEAIIAVEGDKKKTDNTQIIRYTKDELRELNPLGYYHM